MQKNRNEQALDTIACETYSFMLRYRQNIELDVIQILRKKISISSKSQVVIILLIFIVPLLGFFVSYNLITMNVLNERIALTNKNTITLYQKELENELTNIESFMLEMTANNRYYQQLKYTTSKLNAHLASYEILEEYQSILNVHSMVSGMYICSEANALFRKQYNYILDFDLRVNLLDYLKEIVKNGECNTKEWFLHQVNGRQLLIRILGKEGLYTICVVSLDHIKSIEELNSNGGFLVFSSVEGEALTMRKKIENEKVVLKKETNSFYISGVPKQYVIVQNRMKNYDLNMVYLTPYHGILASMDRAQILLIIASGLLLLLIPVCYIMLQASYFRPLSQLVKTMNHIKDGKLDAKVEADYSIREFRQFKDTFNEMMDQIQYFKISAYENEIESQRAQLQYLQKQIRPHLYLNYLKSIYGMAEQDKRKEIQEMILALSVYIRYMFRDSNTVVPLSMELDNIRNYIHLQQMSSLNKISCTIEADPKLDQFGIPPISILTFVENSIKHGDYQQNPPSIFIKARLLSSEVGDFVNITISDNGKGFSEEDLVKLNNKYEDDKNGNHIGIINVKRRFALIYKEQSVLSFSNQANGACIEIFIPMKSNGPENE